MLPAMTPERRLEEARTDHAIALNRLKRVRLSARLFGGNQAQVDAAVAWVHACELELRRATSAVMRAECKQKHWSVR